MNYEPKIGDCIHQPCGGYRQVLAVSNGTVFYACINKYGELVVSSQMPVRSWVDDAKKVV